MATKRLEEERIYASATPPDSMAYGAPLKYGGSLRRSHMDRYKINSFYWRCAWAVGGRRVVILKADFNRNYSLIYYAGVLTTLGFIFVVRLPVLDLLSERVGELLRRLGQKYGVAYAVLFGSAVSGLLRSDSDLDIAIKFERLPKNRKSLLRVILEIKLAIEDAVGRPVDIVVLNGSPVGLQYEVFATGKIVYLSNPEMLYSDKIRAIKMYLDFKYYLDRHFGELVRWIKSWYQRA